MNPRDERGHSSIGVIVILLFISILFVITSTLARQSLIRTGKYRSEMEASSEREKRASLILQALIKDPTPESQSYQDPVWQILDEFQNEGIDSDLKDISSRLNPNNIRTKLFEETDLKRLIQNGSTAESIADKRSTEGFSTDLYSTWLDTFGTENLNRFFTLYSWANINVTHEESLERLYIHRYGTNGASAFRNRIQQGLQEFKLWKKEELTQVMGQASSTLYPVINTLPQINVHYTEPLILESLLSYPYRADPISQSQSIAQQILSQRDSQEITPDQLKQWIDPNEKQQRILEYLGTQTWFWEYSETDNDIIFYWIFAWDGENWYTIERKNKPIVQGSN